MTTHSLPPLPAVPAPHPPKVAWPLLALLTLCFLVVWRLPPLAFLQESTEVFPLTLHNVTEQVAIVVAFLIFSVSWHTYDQSRPANVVLLACGFLGAGLLDFGHMLSYRGMPDFVTPASPNKAITFWLAARYVVALTMLVIALRPWSPLPRASLRWLLLALSQAGVLAVFVIELYFPHYLPVMFIDGYGLTDTKIALEIGIVALTLVAAALFLRRRGEQADAAGHLATAALVTVLSELCFMLYANVNGLFSLVGHLYKVIAFYFIYRAVFVASVREPYQRLEVEVAERQAAEEKVAHLAFHDPLTELPNRLLLRDRVERAISRAQRSGQTLFLIFLDLDNFKGVNDTLGHLAGDALLKGVSQRLSACLRSNDTLSRQGGDEFVILLSDLAEAEHAMPVIHRILHTTAEPFSIAGQQVLTSASAGIAVYPRDGEDFDTLLKHADMAMYRAKAAGRNTYRFFDEQMHVEAVEQLEVRNGLRMALEQRELELHYQPQHRLADGSLVGAEALLRWRRPREGLLAPARFIPIAEDSGLIVPIGEWVLAQACGQAAAWLREGYQPLRMAVNLSSVQFARPGLVEAVKAALQQSSLPPELLELELTESILISDTEHVLKTVQELKALGVRLSIDDFGTGYSSLQYLRRFAVDRLKIDKSFVADLARDSEAVTIARAIVEMAHSLGLHTIAEGVEDQETVTRLRALGCEEGQGYLWARPLPPDEFVRLLPRQDAQAACAPPG